MPARTLERVAARERVPRQERVTLEKLAFEVFRSHPFGMLVFDRDGNVLSSNPAAARILRTAIPQGVHCCALAGARRTSGELTDRCLRELALDAGDALPEIRIDLDDETAVWVTATPLAGSDERVLMQVRPGEPGDRRRRTEPHWLEGPELRIVTLGRTQVASREGDIGGKWLEQRPGQVLKFMLTERHRVVHADEIAEAIWPNADVRVTGNVRHAIHVLRDRVQPARTNRADSWFVLSRQGGYALDSRRVRIDADSFEQHVNEGLAAYADNQIEAAERSLESGMALYGGEFLADEPYADWCLVERDRLRDLASQALRALIDIKVAGPAPHDAADYLQRLAEMHPYDSEINREAIQSMLARGRRSEAVRRYALLRKRMVREFGIEPDFRLTDLA